MEQLPGSLEDLQPQDLSTSSIPSVIDLTRKGEECVLSSTSLDALRVVKSPNWYPNSETGSSDTTLQSGDPVQPNNAFSHTTVTLSYVSRSHVFPTLDSLSRHSPLYGGPPIGKLSLHPPCDLDKGLGEMGSLNQHYLEQVDGPMDLATQSELLQSLSQARGGPEDDGEARLTQEPEDVCFEVSSSDGDVAKDVKGEEEMGGALENGQGDSLGSGEGRGPPLDEERSGSEELMSKKEDSMAARDMEYISHLEDPISPSATSLDNVDDVFLLPQASSSPSGDNSYPETFDEVPWEGLRPEGDIQPDSGISTRFKSSAENKRRVHRGKAASVPLIDLTDDACVSNVSEDNSVVPHMNGNAKVLQRKPKIKKLPARSGRGTRLETIVMSINSSKYKMSGCIQTNKKASHPTASVSKCNDGHSAGRRSTRGRAPFSVKTVKDKAVTSTKRGKTNNIHHDSCKQSTSDSELNNSKTSNGTPPKKPPFSVHKKSKKEAELLSHPDPSVDIHMATCPPPTPPKCPTKGKGKATGSKASPGVKTKVAGPTKRRQKKPRWIHTPSMFAPKEPEIRLKYVNYKEEKRNYGLDSFSPFVRVERQQSSSSLCTLINYPEQVRTQHKKGQQQPAHPSGFLSAVVPSTSCLQLGRVSMHSQHQRALVCCLCGQAANAMDLGDLHGPYYPEGYQPSTQRPASTSGLKGHEDSDTDSSSCSVRGRGRKCLAPAAPRPLRQKGLPESYRRTADGTGRRAAKRTWLVAGSADMEDWYSPPLLPLEPCEYWLHEDCAIWSAGVFLVKGKVYGLEEAVKVAQETMCSKCSDPGATLGCFFKGCPNKYHYRCALETADCVLIEENFSMKCKKHKNKAFKAPPGTRWDNR